MFVFVANDDGALRDYTPVTLSAGGLVKYHAKSMLLATAIRVDVVSLGCAIVSILVC